MENCLDTFAYIKVLKGTDNSGLYADGMRCNYGLENPGNEYIKYASGAHWMVTSPDSIDKLAIGALFVGISKSDSMARKYVIIAKDKEGHGIWFPFGKKDDAEMVISIWKFNFEKRDFEYIFRTEADNVLNILNEKCEEGAFYMSTDINKNMLPIFEIENDDDEDDEDDDEELDPEDQEVLDSLKDITDDDDEGEDRSEFSTMDCIFTCFRNHDGEMQYFTVAQGLRIDEDLHDLEHYLYHANQELQEAQTRVASITSSQANAKRIQNRFNEVFKEFEVVGLHAGIPMEPVMDIPKSSNDIEVHETAITRGEVSTEETADIADEERRMKESVPSLAKYLPEDNPIDPFNITPKSEIDTTPSINADNIDDKAPTEVDINHAVMAHTLNDNTVIVNPTNTDVEDGFKETFGADDSKFEGSDEYTDGEAKGNFGNW